MKIKWTLLLSATLIAAALAGCGTAENNSGAKPGKDAENDNEIVTDSIVPSLTEDIDASKYQYVFALKNETTKEIKLNMNSSQYFDYHLIDTTGAIVYTFSDDKMFTQMLEEKSIQPGDSLVMELDATEGLSSLEKGTYTLEAWSTANEADNWIASTDLTWDGIESAEAKLKVEEVQVTYVGLQDGNSIEVTNEQGETEAMRLSETAKPFFNDLENGQKITVFYVMMDGQKVIQTASKD